MRLLQILLAMVVTCHATSTDGFSVAAQAKNSALTPPNRDNLLKTDRYRGSSVRSLRVDDTKTVKEGENENSEGRALNIVKDVKVLWWAELGKTDDFVMEALKLKGLSGTALRENKNYKYFKKFANIAEGYRLNKWLVRHHFTSYQAWEELGMKSVRTVELEQIKGSNAFRIYKRYVNALDDNVLSTMESGYNPPAAMLSRGATEAEITARVQIMAESKRSEPYAKLALGMTERGRPRVTLNGAALKNHDDYKYYKLFLDEAAKVAKRTN